MPARLETAEGQTRRLDGIRRWIRPTGFCVAILGPDGSGKSSVIEQFVPEIEAFFSGTEYFHLRPHLLGGIVVSQPPSYQRRVGSSHGVLASTFKAAYLWADYALGYLFHVYPRLASSRLVIFDRYYHDLLVDVRRFRYGGPYWLLRLIAHLIPLPDLLLVLDAPPEMLQMRKPGLSEVESVRQTDEYQAVAISSMVRGRAALIDASLPLDEVVQECTDRTVAVLARRTTHRLGLD
jgi:thymidylate kinase